MSKIVTQDLDRQLVPSNQMREFTAKLRELLQAENDVTIEIERLNEVLGNVQRNIRAYQAALNAMR